MQTLVIHWPPAPFTTICSKFGHGRSVYDTFISISSRKYNLLFTDLFHFSSFKSGYSHRKVVVAPSGVNFVVGALDLPFHRWVGVEVHRVDFGSFWWLLHISLL